jgi:hypothetical protein
MEGLLGRAADDAVHNIHGSQRLLNPRQGRWADELVNYDFYITCRPVSVNIIATTLTHKRDELNAQKLKDDTARLSWRPTAPSKKTHARRVTAAQPGPSPSSTTGPGCPLTVTPTLTAAKAASGTTILRTRCQGYLSRFLLASGVGSTSCSTSRASRRTNKGTGNVFRGIVAVSRLLYCLERRCPRP